MGLESKVKSIGFKVKGQWSGFGPEFKGWCFRFQDPGPP